MQRTVVTVNKNQNIDKIQTELQSLGFKIQKVGKSIGVIIGHIEENKIDQISGIDGVEEVTLG